MTETATDFTTTQLAEILLTLRMSLIKIVLIVAIVWGLSFAFFADLLITRMTLDLLPQGANVIYTRPLEGIILKLKVSVIFGFVAALPYVGVLIYRNLKQRTDILKEVNIRKGSALRYAVVSVILLSAGIAYGYYILRFFLQYLYSMAAVQGVLAYYSIAEFINFAVLMLVIFGLIFQMPLIMTFLVGNNIVDYNSLRYYRRHIYVAFFVTGAAITPPDVFTQAIVAFPMILFFEASLIAVRIIHRDKVGVKPEDLLLEEIP